MNEDEFEEAENIAMFTCNYYNGIGTCSYSCHEEPACMVNAPQGGWTVPKSFDMEEFQREVDESMARKKIEDWLHAEERWVKRPTLTPMTETGIYPANPASNSYATGTRFFVHHVTNGGSSTSHCETYEEAEAKLSETEAFFRRLFEEKLSWRANGSRLPDGRQAIVIDGKHYVPAWIGLRPNKRNDCKGYGGRHFKWSFIDDPDATVYETDSLYFQTALTDKQRLELPDNARWV